MVFDIKMEDFRHKARLVVECHMTKASATITYASVVCGETVRIDLMIAAINDVGVKLGNIMNAYVQASVTEKLWTTQGPEFGTDARKTVVIVRALFGAFRSHFVRCIEFLGHWSCKADLDLWPKVEIRPEDGVQYYSYLLYQVDDILCIHYKADAALQQLHQSFPPKPEFGNPDMYFGVKLCNTRLHNAVWAWAMSPLKNV